MTHSLGILGTSTIEVKACSITVCIISMWGTEQNVDSWAPPLSCQIRASKSRIKESACLQALRHPLGILNFENLWIRMSMWIAARCTMQSQVPGVLIHSLTTFYLKQLALTLFYRSLWSNYNGFCPILDQYCWGFVMGATRWPVVTERRLIKRRKSAREYFDIFECRL